MANSRLRTDQDFSSHFIFVRDEALSTPVVEADDVSKTFVANKLLIYPSNLLRA